MDKFVELVELSTGEVVAVGPFHDQGRAQDFAEHVETVSPLCAGLGSRGGIRLLTADALARELGISPSQLKPPSTHA